MKIYVAHIENWLDKEAIQQWIQPLPIAVQTQILTFVRPKDATLTVIAKHLVRFAFDQEEVPFSWEQVAYTNKDRPFLPDSRLDFNISHSGQYVAVVVGRGPCGIDIEQHRKVDLGIFNRQFSPEEWSQIHAANDVQSQFFDFWTIKEAAIKADGRGMSILSKTLIKDHQTLEIEGAAWHYRQLPVDEGYSLAVVGKENERFPEEVIRINFRDLYS